MLLRSVGVLLGCFSLGVAEPASAVPQTPSSKDSVVIPFDPPLGESHSYRWERYEEKDGKSRLAWSVDKYRFEEAAIGFRLVVEPVSYGSDEKDPAKLEFMKKLEELTKRPFVLRLDEDAKITELDRNEEYWSTITRALREVLSKPNAKFKGDQAKIVESVVALFENMPAEARLAMLTESVQPLVEFAYTETAVGQPIKATVETPSPFGGKIKQDVTITLRDVKGGLAYLVLRSSVPRSELERLAGTFVDRLRSGALDPETTVKVKAAMAGLKDFKSETVGEYKIDIETGMLESFESTQTTVVTEGEKTERRIKTVSLKRID